ncbi:hypothetical protein GCM10028808_57800 [Spirosoma migulaei]
MTNTAAQIVAFPFPQRIAHKCKTYGEAVFQLKMQGAQLLNKVAAGMYQLDEGNIEGLHNVNRMCREVGLTPLIF